MNYHSGETGTIGVVAGDAWSPPPRHFHRTPHTPEILRSQLFGAERGRRGSREAETKTRQLHKAPKEESQKDEKESRKETKADKEIPGGRGWERGAPGGTDTEPQT